MTSRIGFIGLGLMGTPIALKMLDAGYPVTVWGRSEEKLQPALETGAVAAASARAVAEASGAQPPARKVDTASPNSEGCK